MSDQVTNKSTVAGQNRKRRLKAVSFCDTDLSTRRREGECAIAFSPDVQLLPTTINY
jgi:hypothetical protein